MKRRTLHGAFAALALLCALAALALGLRLRERVALNDALAVASRTPAAVARVPGAPGQASSAAASAGAGAAASDEPAELQLARATALARAGADDEAFKLYSALVAAGSQDPIARHALYNLGNLYLRQALRLQTKAAAAGSTDAAPLVELAKQRYRDLLRATPGDWAARYNLERALRLAPEEHAAQAEADQTPVERRQVMLRGMDAGDLP